MYYNLAVIPADDGFYRYIPDCSRRNPVNGNVAVNPGKIVKIMVDHLLFCREIAVEFKIFAPAGIRLAQYVSVYEFTHRKRVIIKPIVHDHRQTIFVFQSVKRQIYRQLTADPFSDFIAVKINFAFVTGCSDA